MVGECDACEKDGDLGIDKLAKVVYTNGVYTVW
jgi:hypothetical protein